MSELSRRDLLRVGRRRRDRAVASVRSGRPLGGVARKGCKWTRLEAGAP